MMLNRSFPLESLVNSSVENFKSLILPLSTISTIVPASSELRARRSGRQARTPSYLPASRSLSIFVKYWTATRYFSWMRFF